MFEPDRYQITPESLTISGKGISAADSDPLQFTPGHPSYRSVVKVESNSRGRSGFMIWYSPVFYRGIGVSSDSICYFTEKRSVNVTGRKPGSNVYIRIINDNQALALQYSFDGSRWENATDAADISPYSGNLLGNFRTLKIALFAYGEGSARFSEFQYQPVNNR